MYKLKIPRLEITIELSEKSYKNCQTKKVEDENTGEFLYNAKLINVDSDVLIVAKEERFEKIND